jgi:Xaa-Pro dipeptidase
MISRRELLTTATTLSAVCAVGAPALAADTKTGNDKTAAALKPLTASARPISAQEHQSRINKVQGLMRQQKIGGLLVEAGSTLEYFTGVRWRTSERTTAAMIPAEGRVVIVTPFFEEPSIRESLAVEGDVHHWQEDESPFDLLAAAFRERGAARGALAIDANARYFVFERVAKMVGGVQNALPGEGLVRACRMHKSAAELALMQVANDVTIAAIRHLHAHIEAGMRNSDIEALLISTTEALGGSHLFSLVLLNEASAFPHGSIKPQQVHDGSVILIDSGCAVHGYQSDISRSWVFGAPSARQRELWNTVKRGQEIALETAKLGTPTGAIDKAVRAFYESKGWSKNYGLPGLSHRTGHGIGMDGHEPPYLVRSDTTPLEAGMCFSDEPGLYVPGEFGIRLEDCWHMTETGPKLFTALATSIDQPV